MDNEVAKDILMDESVEAACTCGWAGKESELIMVPYIELDGTEHEAEACPACGSIEHEWIDLPEI